MSLLLRLFFGLYGILPSSGFLISGSSTAEPLTLWMACFCGGCSYSDWFLLWRDSITISYTPPPNSPDFYRYLRLRIMCKGSLCLRVTICLYS